MRKTQYKDLREYLELIEKEGELKVIQGANWEEEIGMATELLNRNFGSPAALFEDIPGVEKGFRVLSNAFNSETRLATVFGFPKGLNKVELSDKVFDTLKNFVPTPPIVVTDGPVLENIMEGDDIDLYRFPTPIWHEEDGGRYLGTGSCVITRDPDDPTDINLGTYRGMISDKNHIFFFVSPGKHGRVHRDKWFARKEPCPFMTVIGGDPLLYQAAGNELPCSEYEWAGSTRGEAYEVILGKYTGLPMPAHAEIVIEGFAHYDDVGPEGPFGEWTGYYASGSRGEPRVEVKAVYYRNDPIILGCPPNIPPSEVAFCCAVFRSPLLKDYITKAGVPDVVATWCHEAGGNRLFKVVSIKQRYPGHATQTGHVASQCRMGAYAGRYIVVVDEDVDVADLGEVIWAVCTRSDPATSVDLIRNCWSTSLDPIIPPEAKAKGELLNSVAVINACRPFTWRDQFPKVNKPSPELWKRTLEKWGHLLKK